MTLEIPVVGLLNESICSMEQAAPTPQEFQGIGDRFQM